MSEALSDLARLTHNDSWLQLAAMFERPCFIGSLATGSAAAAIEVRRVRSGPTRLKPHQFQHPTPTRQLLLHLASLG